MLDIERTVFLGSSSALLISLMRLLIRKLVSISFLSLRSSLLQELARLMQLQFLRTTSRLISPAVLTT